MRLKMIYEIIVVLVGIIIIVAKDQRWRKGTLVRHLDNTGKNAKAEEVAKPKTEEVGKSKDERNDSPATGNEEEKIDYPVSQLIKNAPKLTNSWGQEFYEPLGIQVVSYNGKEYQYYAEDKYYNTVLVYTGNPESLKEGFVLEGRGGGTCKKIGTYKYLYAGAYYKEVKKEELDCSFQRTFFAIYDGCKFSIKNIEEDRITLQLVLSGDDKLPQDFNEKRFKEEGFEETYELGEYSRYQDRRVFTKRNVSYNDPKLKIFVHRHYYDSERLDETEEISFL